MFQGGKGLQDLLKQAQKMQKKMMESQEALASKTVEASAGGGMVTVVMNGNQELISLKIEKEVVDPDDIEMLEDLIIAAVEEARQKVKEMVESEMSGLTGGLKIPGLNT
ncbi:MAG TPA: YbaB/EbfC family nucleoid-associated protein [Candidatus Cloacimonetes bacterium]|nr:YbaB/EbfC family nucleoid-associated protein [Candidatus Cloacimonadota bacterium]HEX37976.1 YbaB/EbfC family nucleoid-associated protein [Candidatus Cloacimonadota bacterium]